MHLDGSGDIHYSSTTSCAVTSRQDAARGGVHVAWTPAPTNAD